MTSAKINIAIAEYLGWRREPYGFVKPDGNITNPNFFTDLNAMHEARKSLSGEQGGNFIRWLNILHKSADIFYQSTEERDWRKEISCEVFDLFNSESSLQAEAFVRVIGKYTEPTQP